MKKNFMKFTKILVLTAMIVSDLMTPIKVFANEISNREPVKGDVGINNKVVNDGNNATIYSGDYETDEALVTKTVTKLDAENGIYNVELRVKGKNREDSTTVTKPVYVVVVFDTSGSMICDGAKNGYSYISERGWNVHYTAADGTKITCRGNYNRGEMPKALTQDKWESAVNGAINFSDSLSKVENTNISLVTFSGSASIATEFSHTALTARDFGHPEGNTNLQAGLSNAIDKLKEITDPNAQKYIVVIGDGQPTSGGSNGKSATDRAMDRAYEAKNDNKITVFSIGYGIENDATAKDVLKKISSDTTMTKVYGYRDYYYEYNKEEKGFYKEANSTGIADSFKTIFEDIKTSIAATNGVLTDVIGDNFKYVDGTKDSQDITVNGKDVTIKVGDITEEEKVYSFNIEIKDKDSATGWYRTNGNDNNNNNSFTLTGDGLTNPITSSESAEVYWVQNTYNYVINYYKDEITNSEIAPKEELGEKLAGTNYTTSPKEILGYTLNENKLPENKDGKYTEGKITVTYYYTKNDGTVEEPKVEKTGPNTINSIDGVFNYTISSSAKIKDYVGNAKLIVKDMLPYTIDINKSKLPSTCTYDGNKTITCIKEYNNITEEDYINGVFEVNASFNLELVFIEIDSDKIINKAQTVVDLDGNKIPSEETETETEVLKGNLVVKHISGNTILEVEDTKTNLGGVSYETSARSFYGYTLDTKTLPDNASGKFVAGSTITVIYNYIKNNGEITENDVTKLQKNQITDINSEYNYVLNYNGKIENYVGEVTLELTDILPYNVVITSMDKRCTLDGKVITCKETYNIDENNQVINESFDIKLRYTNVGSEVTNKVESRLIYGNNEITDEDKVTDKVPYGVVIATYKDTDGNELTTEVQTIDLVGKEYNTEEKDFFGYSLKEINGNENGTYIDDIIYVEYIYTNTMGTGDIEELPPQTGVEQSNLYNYLIIISMLVLSVRGYKKVKETL